MPEELEEQHPEPGEPAWELEFSEDDEVDDEEADDFLDEVDEMDMDEAWDEEVSYSRFCSNVHLLLQHHMRAGPGEF